jgi:hypothetical protein
MDYVATFPLPKHLVPKRLRELLLPIGTDPELRVEVTCFTENEGLGVLVVDDKVRSSWR